jgi:hypothetical protein
MKFITEEVCIFCMLRNCVERSISLPSVDSLVIVKAIADVNPINWSRYGQVVDDIIKEDSISEIVLLEIIALSL